MGSKKFKKMNKINLTTSEKGIAAVIDVLDFAALDQLLGGNSDKDVQVGCFKVLSGGCSATINDQE